MQLLQQHLSLVPIFQLRQSKRAVFFEASSEAEVVSRATGEAEILFGTMSAKVLF